MRQLHSEFKTYSTLSDLIPAVGPRASSLLLADEGRFLLGIRPPLSQRRRFLLRLTGIGGWAEGEETFAETAIREAIEETGGSVQLLDLGRTLVVHSPDDIELTSFTDDTAPAALVYRRFGTVSFDPWSETFESIVPVAVYAGRLRQAARIRRPQELPLFMWVYPEQMIDLANADQPLEYLLADGAELLGPVSFHPEHAIVRLTDSIQALLTALGPRAFLFLSDIMGLTQSGDE